MQLITYADRLAGNLQGLRAMLDNEFAGLFAGVHILPFFVPIDGADAGFDPIDHRKVDPRLGTWADVEDLGRRYTVMADLIVNHMSAHSPQFRDVHEHQRSSRYWQLFLRRRDIFPDSVEEAVRTEQIKRVYRPRPGPPFTTIELGDGSQHDFWTTFSAQQLDINTETAAGRAYLRSILEKFAATGIREVRLDAAGYAIKRPGTTCFMLPETFDFIAELSDQARSLGIETLVETHSHYQMQVAISARVDRVYDFALPPLLLHTLYTSDASALKRWLAIAPRNCVTVLDTHDGIGILDVARQGAHAGLLGDDEIDSLVETIHEKTGGDSRKASGHAASNVDIYQVNSTYYAALGNDDRDYLIARAIQFFSPGTPQVYYVGLLAGENDIALVDRTGVGRDINRHHYTANEIAEALERPVVVAFMQLIRLRNAAAAFDGSFEIEESPSDQLVLKWELDNDFAVLRVDLGNKRATIDIRTASSVQHFVIDDRLLSSIPGRDDI